MDNLLPSNLLFDEIAEIAEIREWEDKWIQQDGILLNEPVIIAPHNDCESSYISKNTSEINTSVSKVLVRTELSNDGHLKSVRPHEGIYDCYMFNLIR